MTDLADEVRACFEKTNEEQNDGKGPLVIVNNNDDELAPGFNAMRRYFEQRLLLIARRGYHHYAGSTMPSSSDQQLELTTEFMMAPFLGTCMGAFSCGVMIGHREEHLVQMCYHFENLEHLFHDEDFMSTAADMAIGFAGDSGVTEFFKDYVDGGLGHLSHVTGFAHQDEMDPAKVWDVWLLLGAATTAASYLAGFKLGDSWRERDVLDGIQIASEGDPRGSEGEG